jgi:hypothetical protein
VSGRLHAPAALPPGKEPLVPIGYEAGWTPEPFWTRWWEKFPAPARNRTLKPRTSSPQPSTIPTELSRLFRNVGRSSKKKKKKKGNIIWYIRKAAGAQWHSLAAYLEIHSPRPTLSWKWDTELRIRKGGNGSYGAERKIKTEKINEQRSKTARQKKLKTKNRKKK